jgi:hypothetical protein
MKKHFLMTLIFFLVLSLSTPLTYGQSSFIQGWWKAQLAIEEMDFATGGWTSIHATGDNASYLYVGADDKAHLIEWDTETQQYYLENTYTVFILGDGLVLKGPYKIEEGGILKKNSTIIMKINEQTNGVTWLKGYYTHYDCS